MGQKKKVTNFFRGAKHARFDSLGTLMKLSCIPMTLTFFLLMIRGKRTRFRLNAQPIMQNFPNKGNVETLISRLFTLDRFRAKILSLSVPSFVM